MSSTKDAIKVDKEFNISRMLEHDLLEVVEIEESCGLSRWGWDAYHTELSNGNGSLMLVARLHGLESSAGAKQIVGFVAARNVSDEVQINNVAVRPLYRRRGIGGALLASALKVGQAHGARVALLEVRITNVAAQAMYARYGFETIGRRADYYTDPPEDAYVMKLVIRHPA